LRKLKVPRQVVHKQTQPELDNGMYYIMGWAYYSLVRVFKWNVYKILSKWGCEVDYLKASKDTVDFWINNFKKIIKNILASKVYGWYEKDIVLEILTYTNYYINTLLSTLSNKPKSKPKSKSKSGIHLPHTENSNWWWRTPARLGV
jgi:hypothetical protein